MSTLSRSASRFISLKIKLIGRNTPRNISSIAISPTTMPMGAAASINPTKMGFTVAGHAKDNIATSEPTNSMTAKPLAPTFHSHPNSGNTKTHKTPNCRSCGGDGAQLISTNFNCLPLLMVAPVHCTSVRVRIGWTKLLLSIQTGIGFAQLKLISFRACTILSIPKN